jgi:HK97 family phage major capsid protein
MNEFMELKRAGRATANAVQNRPLPSGTDSINIPRLATGGATAIQSADNGGVQETDPTDAILTVPVRTIAGQVDVAQQLLDQSPVAVDQMLLNDLIRDYNTKLGVQVLSGAGTSGTATGILSTGSIGAVAYTDASPTVAELWPKLASAINTVATGIYSEPNLIIMHPRRWAWLLSALDTQGRPLVVPNAGGNQAVNAMGTVNGATGGIERVVGQIMGVNVITDPNIPTTFSGGAAGAGTEDVIIVLDTNQTYLYESAPRTRVLPEVGSGTLTVRLQVWGYFAFTAGRYPASIATVAGTGLVAPTF